jgi:enterochelin esterase-like enzyme
MKKFWSQPIQTISQLLRNQVPQVLEIRHWPSNALGREVAIDIYLPPNYAANPGRTYPLLICNDGQDLPVMQMQSILSRLYKKSRVPYLIVVAVHASDRMQEYGTAHRSDYKGRGAKAANYTRFIIQELLPYISGKFRTNRRTQQTAIAGFSLGGLSAFDVGYATPQIFGVVGVFSGSFWWRHIPSPANDPDAGRIMLEHLLTDGRPWDHQQRYWMQVGLLDETDDRNQNGVIDAVDDTRDIITALAQKGVYHKAMRYFEMEEGRHDQATWARAMPDFLMWAFNGQEDMD